MTTNPDIIIATPGRFLHLKVEMGLDLSSVKYIVFDEADRLFEMGFAAQLSEILHALPTTRQTLLFSATLPKTLVEFARAGLQDPKLIRLDAESKVSPDLENAFFTVKSGDRDGALLHILDKVIKMPVGIPEGKAKGMDKKGNFSKKRKREPERGGLVDSPTSNSTIIFVATKHRVEYLSSFLKAAGYGVSYAYGNLDQTARKMQVADFRAGLSNILVVTDVAARGIDLPALANVVNYDFPSQPKIFVHRVGRTARAGRKGWSYSLIRDSDVPYMIDLQLFLGKRLVFDRSSGQDPDYAQDVVVGSLVPDQLGPAVESVTKLLADDMDLYNLEVVAAKGEMQYTRTRNSASNESVKRAKKLLASRSLSGTHLLFGDQHDALKEQESMLQRISAFRPSETVFEVGKKGMISEAAEVVRKQRERIDKKRKKEADGLPTLDHPAANVRDADTDEDDVDMSGDEEDVTTFPDSADDQDDGSDDELEISVSHPTSNNKSDNWAEPEFFMSYVPKGLNAAEDRGFGVHSGSYNTAQQNSSFVEAARGAQMDLTNDEIKKFAEPSQARGMRWDKKNKKYVARQNDDDGSKGVKMVRGESGLKIAASFRSGRYEDWRKSNKVSRMPRTGEQEPAGNNRSQQIGGGRRYMHKAEKAPKEADRYRDDFHVQKKRVDEAKEKRVGKWKDGQGKSEIRSSGDVYKQRKADERKKEKNARPAKKRKA
jgi:ATP-dependent RNA helicase DDX54/DBP10